MRIRYFLVMWLAGRNPRDISLRQNYAMGVIDREWSELADHDRHGATEFGPTAHPRRPVTDLWRGFRHV